jgi:hypothetical protein
MKCGRVEANGRNYYGADFYTSVPTCKWVPRAGRRRAVILVFSPIYHVVCGDPAYHCMCGMQVVDITLMKHRLTSITSIRVVQQKHRRSMVCL